jgi:hypothetical protein
MTALREFMKVKNHTLNIKLPDDFNYENVEVVIMPVEKNQNNAWTYWNEIEIENFGKHSLGLSSNDFDDDNEDYSKW